MKNRRKQTKVACHSESIVIPGAGNLGFLFAMFLRVIRLKRLQFWALFWSYRFVSGGYSFPKEEMKPKLQTEIGRLLYVQSQNVAGDDIKPDGSQIQRCAQAQVVI